MTQQAAFRASYSDMKLVKTRQVAQLIFEIPLADFDAAYEVLGGLPDGSKERWFGIAALRSAEPSGDTKRDWRDLQPAQQAGIRANDAVFLAFLKENYPDDWHESQDGAACIRLICGVHSRTEFGTDHAKRVVWHSLDQKFEAWKALERV